MTVTIATAQYRWADDHQARPPDMTEFYRDVGECVGTGFGDAATTASGFEARYEQEPHLAMQCFDAAYARVGGGGE